LSKNGIKPIKRHRHWCKRV